jgi:hypothetical protein
MTENKRLDTAAMAIVMRIVAFNKDRNVRIESSCSRAFRDIAKV